MDESERKGKTILCIENHLRHINIFFFSFNLVLRFFRSRTSDEQNERKKRSLKGKKNEPLECGRCFLFSSIFFSVQHVVYFQTLLIARL